jgi:hypothetical protein
MKVCDPNFLSLLEFQTQRLWHIQIQYFIRTKESLLYGSPCLLILVGLKATRLHWLQH